MMHSVTIKKAKNGFIVSTYNEKTGEEATTVHKSMKDASMMASKMMGKEMTMTSKQKKEAKKMIKRHVL